MDETTTSMAQASGSGDWWRRNRLWLVGAVVLGALAYWLPYSDALRDYLERARQHANRQHTPHLLNEALSWHERYLRTGTMRAGDFGV